MANLRSCNLAADSSVDEQLQLAQINPNSLTRVMSPNIAGDQREEQIERWGIRGAQKPCDGCQGMVVDLWVCSMCFRSGQPQCLQMSQLEGYAFCSACMPMAVQQHSQMMTTFQKEQWELSLANQLAKWREMSVSAKGALGTLGLAIGGAGAMVVGGTGIASS